MVYGSRSIKRHRRTKAAMGEIHDAISRGAGRRQPMTVRQMFYRLVSAGTIEKTELQYRAVMRAVSEMRRDGRIPFEGIADNTRRPMKYASYPNLEAALRVMRVKATFDRAGTTSACTSRCGWRRMLCRESCSR